STSAVGYRPLRVGGRRSDVGRTSDGPRNRPIAVDVRPPTSDVRPPTSDLRPPTSDLRPPTPDVRRPTPASPHETGSARGALTQGSTGGDVHAVARAGRTGRPPARPGSVQGRTQAPMLNRRYWGRGIVAMIAAITIVPVALPTVGTIAQSSPVTLEQARY